jgi:tetratricopeptide (TPR) repeat protein
MMRAGLLGNLVVAALVLSACASHAGWTLSDYDHAISTDAQNAELYYQRGQLHAGQAAYQPAIADFSQAIKLKPTEVSFYQARADAYRATRDYASALHDDQAGLSYDPLNANLEKHVCLDQIMLGHPSQGSAACDKAVLYDMSDASIYDARSYLRLRLGQWSGAINDASQAIHLDATDAAAYFKRGYGHERAGDTTSAARDYATARKLDAKIDTEMQRFGLVPGSTDIKPAF